jgi:hypothetical protein
MHKNIRDGVTAVVQQILTEHGGVKPTQLIEAARPRSSAAHNGFEWHDGKAADEFRLIQARQWLRVVRVKYEEAEERLIHVPPTSRGHDENGSEGIYKTSSVIIRSPDEFERALAEATATLRAARRAVEELRAAVDLHPSPDRSAMIAQIAKGIELMQDALKMVH